MRAGTARAAHESTGAARGAAPHDELDDDESDDGQLKKETLVTSDVGVVLAEIVD